MCLTPNLAARREPVPHSSPATHDHFSRQGWNGDLSSGQA